MFNNIFSFLYSCYFPVQNPLRTRLFFFSHCCKRSADQYKRGDTQWVIESLLKTNKLVCLVNVVQENDIRFTTGVQTHRIDMALVGLKMYFYCSHTWQNLADKCSGSRGRRTQNTISFRKLSKQTIIITVFQCQYSSQYYCNRCLVHKSFPK